MKIVNTIKESYIYKYVACRVHKNQVEKDPIREINRYYVAAFGHKADLENPKSLIEKIYWMQLHCDTNSWSLLADKYRMRDYVKDKGYGDCLPRLYGQWENPMSIDISLLPSQFVLKTNNGCGTVMVVRDKTEVRWTKSKKKLKQWLNIPFGYSGYQPHYLQIKPCVMAEELLKQDENLEKLSPNSMVDFKFWCFNGRVENCLVCYNRSKDSLTIDLYDTCWNRIVYFVKNNGAESVDLDVIVPKPICLDEMIRIASELSFGQPQMRADFYIVDGKPVIGELTMSTGYGYFTEEYYNYLGSLVDVSILSLK